MVARCQYRLVRSSSEPLGSGFASYIQRKRAVEVLKTETHRNLVATPSEFFCRKGHDRLDCAEDDFPAEPSLHTFGVDIQRPAGQDYDDPKYDYL